MLTHLLHKARAEAEHTVGTVKIGLFAGIALGVGAGFWTLAAWLFLVTVTTPLNAAVIIGAVYSGAGLIGLGVAASRKRKPKVSAVPAPEAAATMDGLVGAFMTGLTAGTRARS